MPAIDFAEQRAHGARNRKRQHIIRRYGSAGSPSRDSLTHLSPAATVTITITTLIGVSMTMLLSRHVETEEAARLGVTAGWYGTKVSGTFVTGPHATDADCLRKIAEIGPVAQDRKI